jgi:hypothetical protein
MLSHEPVLRLGIFLGVLPALLALERLIPWRQARPLGRRRWPANLGLAVLGALLVRAVMPAAAVGAALWAEARGWGLLVVRPDVETADCAVQAAKGRLAGRP